MLPIEFPQQTIVLAKDQPQYTPLPVHVGTEQEGFPMTACFELVDEEVAEIIATRKLWYTQITFGHPFQPVQLSTQNPFTKEVCSEAKETNFKKELAHLLSKYGMENGSNTPDFILANYLHGCLKAYDNGVLQRQAWYTGEKIQ
jgi:hypothetical protein